MKITSQPILKKEGSNYYCPISENVKGLKIEDGTLKYTQDFINYASLQTKLTFDSLPTYNSDNPVKSSGIFNSAVANMLHLGAFDTYTYNSTTKIYTVTRQTGYLRLDSSNAWAVDTTFADLFFAHVWGLNNTIISTNIISNLYIGGNYHVDGTIYWAADGYIRVTDSTCANLNAFKTKIADGLYIQYKLGNSYTENYDERGFARTGQPYIEEWKKSEADRSSNLLIPDLVIG